jgi:hypothetical protein
MNPLRALFKSLATMPPLVMLLIVIGMAVMVTMMVAGKVSEQEAEYLAASAAKEQSGSQTDKPASMAATNGPRKTAYFAITYIPAGSPIESKQVEQRKIGELELWDDAVIIPTDVVGHTPKHAIPVNAQIRQTDLQ